MKRRKVQVGRKLWVGGSGMVLFIYLTLSSRVMTWHWHSLSRLNFRVRPQLLAPRTPLRQCQILQAVPSPPVLRLPFQEGAHGPEIPFVSKKICLLCTFGPEFDSVGESIHCLPVASDEGSPKVNVFEVVLLRLQVGDLADVITAAVRRLLLAALRFCSAYLMAYRRLLLMSSALNLAGFESGS
jgi:hypothetical protein